MGDSINYTLKNTFCALIKHTASVHCSQCHFVDKIFQLTPTADLPEEKSAPFARVLGIDPIIVSLFRVHLTSAMTSNELITSTFWPIRNATPRTWLPTNDISMIRAGWLAKTGNICFKKTLILFLDSTTILGMHFPLEISILIHAIRA